jgi:predicted RNA methylase
MKAKIVNPILSQLSIPTGVFYPDECSIELARLALSYPGNVLDIGTGSGYIAIQLALNNRTVTATEISKKALICAEKNASKLELTSITFIESDLYASLHGQLFDLILYNPPKESHETEYSRNIKTFAQKYLPLIVTSWASSLFYLVNRSARRKSLLYFVEESEIYLSSQGSILINLLSSDAIYIRSLSDTAYFSAKPVWTNGPRTILRLSRQ